MIDLIDTNKKGTDNWKDSFFQGVPHNLDIVIQFLQGYVFPQIYLEKQRERMSDIKCQGI